MIRMIRSFFKTEAAGGVLLVMAAIAAMLIANSPVNELYQHALYAYVFGMSSLIGSMMG
ncbi:Na+/H+ antiporter NhaA [Vibrio metschnikovii]